MNEEMLVFGPTRALVGIITDPPPAARGTSLPAVLLVNAGLVHRVGPNRLYVKLARSLAALGCVVLRFDLSGLGDSTVRDDHLPFDQSAVSETQEAMDALRVARGVEHFLLSGLCSGALIALTTASCDARVVGVIPINAPTHQLASVGDAEVAGYLRHDNAVRRYWTYWKTAVGNPNMWRKALTGQAAYRTMVRWTLRTLAGQIRSKVAWKRVVAARAQHAGSRSPRVDRARRASALCVCGRGSGVGLRPGDAREYPACAEHGGKGTGRDYSTGGPHLYVAPESRGAAARHSYLGVCHGAGRQLRSEGNRTHYVMARRLLRCRPLERLDSTGGTAMSSPGWGRWRRWGRRWWLRMQPRALIVVYHRIAEPTLDPQLLCVSPQHFAEHLEVIHRSYAPLSLRELGQRLWAGRVPSRALVVTFDDGYADNLFHAKPLLARYGVPATVFVVSGSGGPPREFWWDTLARLVLYPSALPHHLQITVAGQAHTWDLGSAATWTTERCQRYRGWNVTCRETPTPRHAVYRGLHQVLRSLDDRTRSQVLQDVATAAQLPDEGHCPPRGLTPEEVRHLSENYGVEIGAHTTTHARLAHHTVAEQREEIQESRRVLEAMIDRPVRSFAYPFGVRGDFNSTTVALVREAGFYQACTALPGVVTAHSDRWQLPRFIIRNWDGEEFARRLRTRFAP